MIFWEIFFPNFEKIVKISFRKKSQKIFEKIRNFSVSTLLKFQNIFPNIQNFARSRKIELKIINFFEYSEKYFGILAKSAQKNS